MRAVDWGMLLAAACALHAPATGRPGPASDAPAMQSHGPDSCVPRLRHAAPAPPALCAELCALRGGGRKLKAKPKHRGQSASRRTGAAKHEGGAASSSAAAAAVEAGGPRPCPRGHGVQARSPPPAEAAEGPQVGPPPSARSRRPSEVADMLAAAADQTGTEGDVDDDVGLPYQESTPLRRGHTDKMELRDAASYCAEAARCLDRCAPDDAEACYQEALKLEPKTPWILNAYASLLADQGRIAQATRLFRKSIKVDANNSHVPHMYLGQVCISRGRDAVRSHHCFTGVHDSCATANGHPGVRTNALLVCPFSRARAHGQLRAPTHPAMHSRVRVHNCKRTGVQRARVSGAFASRRAHP